MRVSYSALARVCRTCAFDAVVVLGLSVAAVLLVHKYVGSHGDYGYFYEEKFGPSVMFAFGRGMVQPHEADAPAITAFLHRKTPALDPAQVPATLRTDGLSRQQYQWLYLHYLVGWVWRLSGVSWQALVPLYCVLYAMTCVSAYGLFRLAASPLWSLGSALLILTSPQNLFFVTYLRDYAKAPLILIALFLLGVIIRSRPRGARLCLVALCFGTLVGLGLGIRKDLLICLPPGLVVLWFFGCGDRPWHCLRSKLAASGVLLLAFYLVSIPLRKEVGEQGSLTMHHIIGGQMSGYSDSLGVGGVPYTLREQQDDIYIFDQVAAHDRYTVRNAEPVEYYEVSYDAAATRYFVHLAEVFPGDLVLEAWAAVRRVLLYAPFIVEGVVRDCLANATVAKLFNFRWTVFGWLAGLNIVFVLGALGLLFYRSFRLGAGVLFLTLYFSAYSVIQFDLRHFFHLEVLFWWFPLFLLAQLVAAIWFLGRRRNRLIVQKAVQWRMVRMRKGLLRAGAAALGTGLLILVPLSGARAMQAPRVQQLLSAYEQAALAPLKHQVVRKGMRSFIVPEGPVVHAETACGGKRFAVHPGVLVLDINCQRRMSMLVQYSTSANNRKFTHEHVVHSPAKAGTGPTRVFIPLFESTGVDEIKFESLQVATADVNKIFGIYRVEDLSTLPLLISVQLQPGWQRRPLQLSLQPSLLPLMVRGRKAARANLCVNGGFEAWEMQPLQPEHFVAPSGAPGVSIAQETDAVYDGRLAVRQTWNRAENLAGSAFERFGTAVRPIAPNTTYALFVDASNLGKAMVQISVWQMRVSDQRTTAVQWGAVQILPGVPAWKEYAGVFSTLDAEAGDILAITVELVGAKEFPTAVLWDNWRLTPVEK